MINEINISNFKSIKNINLQLGQFNIFIGSNGSGKSNVLEAIAFGGAASADKLDNEFLFSRGIRTSNAQLMKNAFSKDFSNEPISIKFTDDKKNMQFTIEEESKPILKWSVKEKQEIEEVFNTSILQLINDDNKNNSIVKNISNEEISYEESFKFFMDNLIKKEGKDNLKKFFNMVFNNNTITELYRENYYNSDLANFIIYSPENSSLRKLEVESQIKPIGINGEGLFNILQIFNESYGIETMNKLKAYLHMIEWFDDFEAVYDKITDRKSLVVKDRYMKGVNLNHSNVNEGFLFLLFYASLLLSNETPSFFAIDNIEASFHPTLCKALTKNLIELSKENKKQIIITTHNPYVLDGLNLNNPDQKLFVINRNSEGETIAVPILTPPKNVKLSEAWMKGYIGGQPETIE